MRKPESRVQAAAIYKETKGAEKRVAERAEAKGPVSVPNRLR